VTATYLVEVELSDPSELAAMSDDILEAVSGAGIVVNSVKPWQRPTLSQAPPVQQAYPLPPPIL